MNSARSEEAGPMKHRIWWLVALGVLLMGLGLNGARAVMAAGSAAVPEGVDLIEVTVGSEAQSAVGLDALAEAQAQLEGSRLSWWALGRGTIGTDDRNTIADVYGVTGAFQDFHHMDMLYGSFLPRTRNGSNAVVLESDLANRLFGTENAVGLAVEFMGVTFQVCGVCRTDSSILGLVSSNSQFRAYVTGYDLVNTGKLEIGGMEALLPEAAPGVAMQTLKTALQEQGLPTASMLFADSTDRRRVDDQLTSLPLAAVSLSAMAVLLAIVLRSARGLFLEARGILREDYFRNAWGALLWRVGKLLLITVAAAALSWFLWRLVGLEPYLPAKYIPGSWIDLSFYQELIRSESQAAIEAASYSRQWWAVSRETALAIGRALNSLAVLGAVTAALSLRVLWADRKWEGASRTPVHNPGRWDIPVLWGLALLGYGLSLLLTAAVGLPLYTSTDVPAVQGIALTLWALALHRDTLDRFLFKQAAAQAAGSRQQKYGG